MMTPTRPRMPSMPKVAGRYELVQAIGEGGMGVVYRARDTKTKSFVALKTMRDISDPQALELFEKEWGVLAGLSHPNIVDIRDVGEIEEGGRRKPFFVMPLLPGVSLDKLIQNSSDRLTVERIVEIITQTCRGLQAAHEQGLVHRDLKPSNIFVLEDDTAKIIDFGVVHLAGAATITGRKGTLQYMAPEQMDMGPVTPASDIFSLGVVTYEALTGRKPFARKTQEETANAVRTFAPPSVSEINPAINRLIGKVVHKAMAKQPLHRFSSARDFADTLRKAFNNQPIDRFDRAKIAPRIERAQKAFSEGDLGFALEILDELDAEGHVDNEISMLREQIGQASRQKRIRQLLESARTRIEQDEIPLALEKIKEALEIDGRNPDALALRKEAEQKRSAGQIDGWIDLARQHLSRHDYNLARQALREVLSLKPTESRAIELMSEVTRLERDTTRTRQEKEQLYQQARAAFEEGELSTALSRLERLLTVDRDSSGAAASDRDAEYQQLYNQVRSERDTIRSAYEEGRRQLAEKNFPRALEICDENLTRHPNDAMFQALKLEISERQRQDLSAYIAEVGRRAEAEPDLDRRVNIYKQAIERYPQEAQFQTSLKLVRERRDLVQSIIGRARQYEERSQFAESVGQWDILRSIHPEYPGIDYEVSQLRRRREEQSRDEDKARRVEEIDREMETGDFEHASRLIADALREFPLDPELIALSRNAAQALERLAEARQLVDRAHAARAEGRTADALTLLRSALELDERTTGIRAAFAAALLEEAQRLFPSDQVAAEQLLLQLLKVEPDNVGAKSLLARIGDERRKEGLNRLLADIRELKSQTNFEAALVLVERALAEYPNESRLLQQQAQLRSSVADSQRRTEKQGDLNSLMELRQGLKQAASPEQVDSLLDRSRIFRDKYGDDADVQTLLEAFDEDVEGRRRLLQNSPTVSVPALTEVRAGNVGPVPAPKPGMIAKLAGALALEMRRLRRGTRNLAAVTLDGAATQSVNLHDRIQRLNRWQQALLFGVPFLVVVLSIQWISRGESAKEPTAASPVAVPITVIPADATVTIDGAGFSGGAFTAQPDRAYLVAITKRGYRPVSEQKKADGQPWQFTLQPEPLRVHVFTGLASGKVLVDGQEVGELQGGDVPGFDVPPGDHTIKVVDATGEVAALPFRAEPGATPVITGPVNVRNLLVITSFVDQARIYGDPATVKANIKSKPVETLPADGLTLDGLSKQNNELVYEMGREQRSMRIELENAPVLTVSLNSNPSLGMVTLVSNVEGIVNVDGKQVNARWRDGKWFRRLTPGNHVITLTHPDYIESQQTVQLEMGESKTLTFELKGRPVHAALQVKGTPNAEVLLDGKPLGKLDAAGNGRWDELAPGAHRLEVRLADHEPSTSNIELVVNQSYTANAQLNAYGSLLFQITPADAAVTYALEGEQPKLVKGETSVRVRAGRYTVTAERDGHESRKYTGEVAPGKDLPVQISLNRIEAKAPPPPKPADGPGDFLQNTDNIKIENQWWQLQRGIATLRPGLNRFWLVMMKPGEGFAGRDKHLDLVLDGGKDNQVTYEITNSQLRRKARIAGKELRASKPIQYAGDVIQLQVVVEADRIVITNKGQVIDELVAEGVDFQRMTRSIRQTATFKLSR